MQAAQRNTASDLPKPAPGLPAPYPKPSAPPLHESVPESAVAANDSPSRASAFLSPITSPISAARRYLERQRGEAAPGEAGGQGPVGQGPGGQGSGGQGSGGQGSVGREGRRPDERGAYARDAYARDAYARDAYARNPDRRLERSLYEGYAGGRSAGHSSEPGLDFDPGPGLEPDLGSQPHPEAVRGAISRLARAAQPGAEGAATERGWAAARARLTPGVPVREFQQDIPVHADAEAHLPFAEVARRLWGTGTGADSHFTAGAGSALPAPTPSDPAPLAPLEISGSAWRSGGGPEPRPEPSPEQGPGQQREDDGSGDASLATAERPGSTGFADAGQLLEPSAEAGPVAVRPDHTARTAAAACPADDAPSLAHDACNLLSALGLYGELLAFPGVLEPRDRHYAEELKLLAARSEVLIGRLLHAGRAETAATDLSAGNLAVGNAAVGAAIGAASVTSNSARTMETASPARHHVSPMTAVEDPASGEVGSTVRADAGGVPVGPRPQTNLVDLLMRWGSLLSTLAHGTLEVAFGPGAATPVAAGAEPLERILVNLVRNARAATVAGGSIRITVGVRPGVRPGARPGAGAEAGDGPQVVVLTVDDSGCGMTAEQLGRVLNVGTVYGPDPVAHHVAAKTQVQTQVPGRRRGLGLQIVRELVAASGGELFAESRLGTGTRIEIHWPVRGAGAGSAAPPVRTDPTARTETTAGAAAAAHGAVSERPSAGPVAAPEVPAHELLAPNTWARGEANPGAHVTAGADLAVEVAANLAVGLTAGSPTGSPTGPPTGPPTQSAVAAETTAAVRPWPKVSPMAGPPRARAAEPAAVPLERTAVGPDGFTEEQLRTMMLRLHRSAPGERPGERPADRADARPDARPDSRWSERIGGRIRAGTGYRPGAPAAQAAEGRPGPSRTAPGGATGATALDAGLDARLDARRTAGLDVGLDVGRDAGTDDSPRQGTNRGATEDSALKGAIAC